MSIFDLFAKIEKEKPSAQAVSCIVAGLGNPEAKYTNTRHNIGFMALDYISQKYDVKVNSAKFHALCGEANIAGERVLLMKPQTYMNASGIAISEAAKFYKIQSEKIIVLCDDINLAAGGLRIRKTGSAGGHNGLKSIIEHLGTEDFLRVRIGAGLVPEGGDIISWVLGKIPEGDRQPLFDRLGDSAGAIEYLIRGDIDGAMGKFNRKG